MNCSCEKYVNKRVPLKCKFANLSVIVAVSSASVYICKYCCHKIICLTKSDLSRQFHLGIIIVKVYVMVCLAHIRITSTMFIRLFAITKGIKWEMDIAQEARNFLRFQDYTKIVYKLILFPVLLPQIPPL